MRAIAIIVIGLAGAAASADEVWNEFNHGDLSTDPNAPTPLAFGLGGNTIVGSVRSPEDTRDYITFEIPAGMGLVSLMQHQWQDLDTGGEGNVGFHAINAGPTSFIPSNDTIDLFLGADHMTPRDPGTDLLPDLANANLGGSGFEIPLGPGTYSYLVQQTGMEHTGYTLEFVLIPGPGGLAVLGFGAAVAARRRR
jgi:hypothetical protein